MKAIVELRTEVHWLAVLFSAANWDRSPARSGWSNNLLEQINRLWRQWDHQPFGEPQTSGVASWIWNTTQQEENSLQIQGTYHVILINPALLFLSRKSFFNYFVLLGRIPDPSITPGATNFATFRILLDTSSLGLNHEQILPHYLIPMFMTRP